MRTSSNLTGAGRFIALAMLMSGCGVAETPTATSDPSAAIGEKSSADPSAAGDLVPFPLEASIPELQAALESGELTSVKLVEFYLERIAAYDQAGPQLNALIHVNPRAAEEAEALDAERAAAGPRGPLHGIPIVVKDNLNTSDMPTTGGSLALEGFMPTEDAFQIERLRDAGAIILAKANLYELAHGWEMTSPVGGQTLNPYDISRDPGGSSGGTAVAVSANFAAAGLGTDTCGSVRLPAAHNNLYSLRPTLGLTSRTGVIPFSFTLDTVGPMARNVVDLAILLEATAGQDQADQTTVPVEASFMEAVDTEGLAGRRLGLVSRGATAEIDDAVQAALDEMEAKGVEFVEVSLPPGAQSLVPTFLNEFRFALEDYLAGEPNGAGALAEILAQDPDAAGVPSLETDEYREALASREAFRDAVMDMFTEHNIDAVAYPVSPTPAARIGGSQDGWSCAAASIAGAPAIAIPVGFTSDGLPVGLELMARPFDEATLLSIAAGYEAIADHRMLPPTTPPLNTTP